MLRFLCGGLAILALIVVAAMVPIGHGAGEFAPARPAAPVAKRPAWPAWAHGAAAAAAVPAPPRPAEHSLSAAPGNERQAGAEHAGLSRRSADAGMPDQHEQGLRLRVQALRGVARPVPTPPPRFA